MEVVKISTESIKLGQFLKLIGAFSTGGETRDFLIKNTIKINQKEENQRGKKIFLGDFLEINGKKYLIEAKNDCK